MGRPPKPTEPLTTSIMVRVPDRVAAELRADADRRGATVSEIIREAIVEYLGASE